MVENASCAGSRFLVRRDSQSGGRFITYVDGVRWPRVCSIYTGAAAIFKNKRAQCRRAPFPHVGQDRSGWPAPLE